MQQQLLAPVEILIVDDNPGDIILLITAFKSSKIAHNIQVANDGLEALDIINKKHGKEEVATPDIILLDLNLPDMEGHEILKYIKHNPAIKRIPVLIMSSSATEQDISKAYDNYASGYIVKPSDPFQLESAIRTIEEFWFSLVERPSKILQV